MDSRPDSFISAPRCALTTPGRGTPRENPLLAIPRLGSLGEDIEVFVMIDPVVAGKSMLGMLFE
ncbi:hypothetical protein [Caballeronia sp. KNU42]